MAKKSVEYLASFYSGNGKPASEYGDNARWTIRDIPWRGTTKDKGPEYLDLESLAETLQERIAGVSASPIRREVAVGASAYRVIKKSVGNGGKPDNY